MASNRWGIVNRSAHSLMIVAASVVLGMGLTACKDKGQPAVSEGSQGAPPLSVTTPAPGTPLAVRAEAKKVCGAGDKPCHLFDHLPSAKITGNAVEAANLEIRPSVELLIDEDFEDGGFTSLLPFDGKTGAPILASELVQGMVAVKDIDGNKRLEIAGQAKHGISACTTMLPVDSSEFYELNYSVAGQGVSPGNRENASYGGVSVEFYHLGKKQQQRLKESLADPGLMKRASVRAVGIEIPQYNGTFEWRDLERTFTPPIRATHMLVCLNLSKPKDPKKRHMARGKIWYDNVRLKKVLRPPHRRVIKYESGFGQDHPLKTSVQLRNSISSASMERRYGIYAPAPSAFTYALKVPEGGLLTFGAGVLSKVHQQGIVSFEVVVNDGESEQVVHSYQWGKRRTQTWQDQRVDLSAFAGKEVQLTLRTVGPDGESEAGQMFKGPGGGAVFSYPILESTKQRGKNVVLFVFDTLPAKRTSAYGYDAKVTPNLSKLAKRSTRFERAITPAPWTLPSFASMMTGLWPAHHRAGEITPFTRWRRIPLESRYTTVAQHLRNNGYQTFAWTNNPYLNPEISGLHVGFSRYVDYGTRGQVNAAKGAVAEIQKVMSTPSAVDRFFFVHIMDPHGPYRPNPEYKKRFLDPKYKGVIPAEFTNDVFVQVIRSQLDMEKRDYRRVQEYYDAVVAYSDEQLGKVLKAAEGSTEDLFFMVTSDHGEELWEHEYFEHGQSLYDEVVKVPMVVYRKGEEAAVRTDPVSLIDVLPTVLEEAGVNGDYTGPGRSMFGQNTSPRTHFTLNMLYGPYRYGVEAGGYKYMYNAHGSKPVHFRSSDDPVQYEIYELAKDPQERKNLYDPSKANTVKQATAMHDQLVTHFADACKGCVFVYVDGKAGESTAFEAKFTLGEGSSWQNEARALTWPNGQGDQDESVAQVLRARLSQGVTLKGEAERSVFFLYPSSWTGNAKFEVSYSVTSDLEPPVFYGEQRNPAQEGSGEADREQLLFSIDAFDKMITAGPSASPRVVIGRLPGEQSQSGAATGGDSSDDLEAGLKELGYLED